MLAQGGQNFGFVDTDTVLQLTVHFVIDFVHQLDGRLYAFLVFGRLAGGDGLVVGHPYLVEFFQVGRIDGDEVDAFV